MKQVSAKASDHAAHLHVNKDVGITIISVLIMIFFSMSPPIEPLTAIGMRVVGVFIATVILISLVDTAWPAILSLALFALTGVMTMNEIIAASFGNWVVMFMLLNFVLADLLNNVGFINRLLAFFLSRRIVQKGPWHLTFVLLSAALVMGLFMEATAMVVFFLGFSKKLFAEAGYEKDEAYPHILSMGLVFAISIAQTMTPFSHFLVIYGLDLYSQMTGNTLGMATYMLYAVPIGIILFITMLVMFRFIAKPDVSKIKNLKVSALVEKTQPMQKREFIAVSAFVILIAFWIFPEVITLIAPDFAFGQYLKGLGVTFYLIVTIALLAVVPADGEPVLSLYYSFRRGVNLKVIFLATACILMGNMVTNDKVGLNQLILNTVEPMVSGLSPLILMLILVAMVVILTNLTSNLTALLLILGVGLSMAQGGLISPIAVTLALTYTSGSAFILPASSHLIGMLYGDEYANSSTTFKYGFLLFMASIVISTFIGWPLFMLVS